MHGARSGKDSPTLAEVRERRVGQVLASLYLLSSCDLHGRIARHELEEDSKLGPSEFFDAFSFGEQSGLCEMANFSHAAISYEGIVLLEQGLRALVIKGGREAADAAGLGRQLLLWQRVAWERFLFLNRLYELCLGRLKTWVDHRKLEQPELGFGSREVDRTYYFLSAGGLLDTSSNQGLVGLTTAGIREAEELIGEVRRAGKGELGRDDYFTLLEARWKSEGSGGQETAPQEYPNDMFQDLEGVWLTAPILQARYEIPDSRLKEWRENGCQDLGHRLRAKKVAGVGWVYLRHDVEIIADRRDSRATVEDKLGRLKKIVRTREELVGDSEDENQDH